MNELLTIGGWAVTGLFAVIGWFIKMIFGRLKDQEIKHDVLEGRLSDHKLHTAQFYSTKADMKEIRDEIVNHLVRIEDKLDKKADK